MWDRWGAKFGTPVLLSRRWDTAQHQLAARYRSGRYPTNFLTEAVTTKITERPNSPSEWLEMLQSVKAEGGLRELRSSRHKVGLNEPGGSQWKSVAQRIKIPRDNRHISPRVRFGTSMSAHHIWGRYVPRVGCSSIKAYAAGFRTATVICRGRRDLSAALVRGPEWTDRWCTSCPAKGSAG